MGLIRRWEGSIIVKFCKLFYDVDDIISVLTKYQRDYDNAMQMDFSSISDNTYITVSLTPKIKNPVSVRTIVNSLL